VLLYALKEGPLLTSCNFMVTPVPGHNCAMASD
jgi:hypothetical protein